jgi:hypothetical protein
MIAGTCWKSSSVSIWATRLAENEQEALEQLGLLQVRPQPHRQFFMRVVTWFATRAGRVAATILLVWLWFAFVAQIFIGQFFNYHPLGGWLNQPLVQLPWFHYLPSTLKNSVGEILFTAILFLGFCVCRQLAKPISAWTRR